MLTKMTAPRAPLGLGAWGVFLVLASCQGDRETVAGAVRLLESDEPPSVEVEGLWGSEWLALPGMALDTVVPPSTGETLGLVGPLFPGLLGDGRFLLGDAGANQVWIASEAGDWIAGPGPGEGPGELRSLGGVWGTSQGFAVHDPLAGSLVLFSPRGELAGRVPVTLGDACPSPMASGGPWRSSIQPLGTDRWLAGKATVSDADRASVLGGSRCFAIFAPEAPDREIRIGSGPLQPFFVEGGGAAPVPFAALALGAAGSGRVAFHSGDSPVVLVTDSEGRGALRVSWADAPRPLASTHRAVLGEHIRAQAPSDVPPEALDPLIAQLEDAMPFPETLPHLGHLWLGDDGAIWLGSPERPGLALEPDLEPLLEWRVLIPDVRAGVVQVYQGTLPTSSTLLGPVRHTGPARAPGWVGSVGPGDLFVHFRDDMDRSGIALLRHDAGR